MHADSGSAAVDPIDLLTSYRLSASGLYTIGTFDRGITVLSQQVRALNLVWALLEARELRADREGAPARVAIIGGGFSGLTAAAGLLAKGANARVVLFEQRDSLLPLQAGSDARWLHPHIYEWPGPGSESPSAGLPLLNWTANRASDVVVEVLDGWSGIVRTAGVIDSFPSIEVFCNTRHLQIRSEGGTSPLQIEWVGESRDPSTLTVGDQISSTAGSSAEFDLVILAVGFGIEEGTVQDAEHSYWRNETLAQPHLDGTVATYVVSGAGDGGLIDLCRLRIAQFRQDRILFELFGGRQTLVQRLREIETGHRSSSANMFEELTHVWDEANAPWHADAQDVVSQLRGRLRRDSEVVLHLRYRSFADVFDADRRASFQNKLLAFLLYRVGAFYPATGDLAGLAHQLHVVDRHVVVRHGTEPFAALRSIVDDALWGEVEGLNKHEHRQSDVPSWSGGYFGYRGSSGTSQEVPDTDRATWRKEYLPVPTQAIATAFCSAVAGRLSAEHDSALRLRVTLHRTFLLGYERLLQQCCEYTGLNIDRPSAAAGRTFESTHATIGLASQTMQTVRTRRGATRDALERDMATLQLETTSRVMLPTVRSVLALPLLSSTDGDSDVVGVVYVDSEANDAFVDDRLIEELTGMATNFMNEIGLLTGAPGTRLVNSSFWSRSAPMPLPLSPGTDLEALERVPAVPSPRSATLARLNIDLAEFRRVEW